MGALLSFLFLGDELPSTITLNIFRHHQAKRLPDTKGRGVVLNQLVSGFYCGLGLEQVFCRTSEPSQYFTSLDRSRQSGHGSSPKSRFRPMGRGKRAAGTAADPKSNDASRFKMERSHHV